LIVGDDDPRFPPDFDPTLSSYAGMELVQHLTQWDLRGEITVGSRPEGRAQVTVTLLLPVVTQEEWK